MEEAVAAGQPDVADPAPGHRVRGAHHPAVVPQRHEQGPGHRPGQQARDGRRVSVLYEIKLINNNNDDGDGDDLTPRNGSAKQWILLD